MCWPPYPFSGRNRARSLRQLLPDHAPTHVLSFWFMRIVSPVSDRHVQGWFRKVMVSLCSLLIATTPAWAQVAPAPKAYVDSLQQALKQAPPDSNRLQLLEVMCTVLYQDLKQYTALAEEGRRLAHRLGSRHWEGRFLVSLGFSAFHQDDLVRAATYYQQAAQVAEASWREQKDAAARATDVRVSRQITIGRAECGLGDVAGAEDDFMAASQHYRRALRWALAAPAEHRSRTALLALSYSSLLKVYAFRATTGHPDDSLLTRAHEYAAAIKQVALALRQQGNIQAYMGHMANAWSGESELFALEGKLDSAIAINQRAAAHYEQLGALPQYLTVRQHLINQQAASGHHAQAIALARETQQIAHENEMGLIEADCFSSLGISLSKTGDWRGAYLASVRALDLRDSLLSAEKRDAISELQVRFDTERKEGQIRELSQREQLAQAQSARQRQQLWALAAVLLAVVAGGAIGTLLFVRLRRSQHRLTHLTELKDQLFAIIGHDLRAPVASFRQVAPLLYTFAQHPDRDEQTELAQSFDRTSADLAALLDNLLDWGRVQTRALTVRAELTNMAQLLAAEARLVATIAAAKQLTVTVTVADTLPLVATDPTLLRVVVRNLLTNALKYTRPGGTITLFAEATPGGTIEVGVRDTGLGMTPDRLQQILGDAPRNSTRGTAGETGTGLGLRVATAFARELGAPLSGQSAVGAGTTFRLALPAGG